MAEHAANFAGWLRENFDAAALANPSISGPQADADADGLTTLMEFVLGPNPILHDAPAQLPAAGIANVTGDDYMILSFRRRKPGSDFTCRARVSSDLTTWTELMTIHGLPLDAGDGSGTVAFRDALGVSDTPRRFMRLRVSW